MATPQTQRSVADVLQDIVSNLQQMMRSEFRLAKAEIREKADEAANPAMLFGTSLILGIYGVGFLLLAAVYGLSIVMASWLAALLVGGVLAILAAMLMASSGKRLKRINAIPEKTLQSLEENVQWAKNQIK